MRFQTTAAKCAKAIREELKAKFPEIKFRVTSQNFSMGNSVNVSFTGNQEALSEVRTLVKRYQEGGFDGMTDSYDYSNKNESIPQVMFTRVEWEEVK